MKTKIIIFIIISLFVSLIFNLNGFFSKKNYAITYTSEVWVDDDFNISTPGWGTTHFSKIQDGIDAVDIGGTVNVYPGTYNETASNRYLFNGTGPYQFGLFINKDGIKIQGVDGSGNPIIDYNNVSASVKTNATNSFGYSGIFIESDNVTITGLEILDNYVGGNINNNKTIEVIGDAFTLKYCKINVTNGGSVYINDWRATETTSHVKSYTIENNLLMNGSSVDISNGAGLEGYVYNRKIINNKFQLNINSRAVISFNGSGTGVPWYVYSVGGAIITGNEFSEGYIFIRARGTYDNLQFDWKSYFEDNNYNDGAVITLISQDPFEVKEYSYTSGSYTFNHVRRIGGIIQKEIDEVAESGDTILALPGEYREQVIVNESLNLIGVIKNSNKPVIKKPDNFKTFKIPEQSVVVGNYIWQPLVFAFGGVVDSGGNVSGPGTIDFNISNFIIDGELKNPSGTTPVSAGILLRNVKKQNGQSVISNNLIKDMYPNGHRTFGIIVFGDSDVLIEHNEVNLYGRGGIQASGDKNLISGSSNPTPNAIIQYNKVKGPGSGLENYNWAQNGIQISWKATGKILHNSVSGNYHPTGASSGIIIAASDNVEVGHNDIFDNDNGIAICGYMWNVNGNTADGTYIHHNNIYQNLIGITVQNKSINTNIEYNNVHNNKTNGIEIWQIPNYSGLTENIIIKNNVISNNNSQNVNSSAGIYISSGIQSKDVLINYNIISNNNKYGVRNDSTNLVNAKYNYWGKPSGPYDNKTLPNVPNYNNPYSEGDNVTSYVDYKPYSFDENFNKIGYSIYAKATSGGTITPSGNILVEENNDITFQITPDTNYKILDVIVDGESKGPINSYTFEKVTANHTIEAKFKKTYSICGYKWNDINNNGTWDTGEPGLSGWTIYIDLNKNGELDNDEPHTTTDLNGHYCLSGIELDFTNWYEYPNNPVFDPQSKPYYPTIVKISDTDYRMWYGSDTGVGYAASTDGINWTEIQNPVSGLSSGANHPCVVYDSDGFGGTEYKFKIWYWSGIGNVDKIDAIRTAVSKDGITWENDQVIQQHASNKSLQIIAGWGIFDNYFYHLYGPAHIIYNPDGTNTGSNTPDDKSDDEPMSYKYIMYYDTSSEGTSPEKSEECIALAYSTDGIYWIRYGDKPILIPSGNNSDWDGKYITRGTVIKLDDGTYGLWYSGGLSDSNDGIGYAYSLDGINWIKSSSNPIFHQNDGVDWRNDRTYTPIVIKDGCSFKMWFSGKDKTNGNYTIGLAYLDNTFRIREILKYGWIQTYPSFGYHDITLCNDVTDINFGNHYINADLSITKDVSPINPNPYDTIIYTITVKNNGPDKAVNVISLDNIPSNITNVNIPGSYNGNPNPTKGNVSIVGGILNWDIGSLEKDEEVILVFTATVTQVPVENCVSIQSDTPDLVTQNNNYCITTNVNTFVISGYKWNDINNNGTWDTGEPGLSGWTIQL
ncbi:MAG: right-handed parallel beta-helix repeat-containing protein, partial [Caldisericia bacterium]